MQQHTQDCTSNNMLGSQTIGEYIVMGVQRADQMKRHCHTPVWKSNLQNCNIYIGNLGKHGSKAKIEQAFGVYMPLHWSWAMKNPPGFAFVEFENPQDAIAVVQGLNGKTLCGSHVRVESLLGRDTGNLLLSVNGPYRYSKNSVEVFDCSQAGLITNVFGPLPTDAHILGGESCDRPVTSTGYINLISF
ncbi:hypothetical protein XELAEV_18046953mg [Xenopus laevis]|uniref:RRM domain-containing protein n=1 Tax=Xenopus laevis TaxID=8355 RepID=A0A974BTX4_XENLA|nr:hypothetical protein XELAEV_18046953mg [Xenopus laevis]